MGYFSILDLDQITEAITELDQSLADYMYGAAVMCLHENRHQSGVSCALQNLEEALGEMKIVWTKPFSERIRRTFGETGYAVEFAAEGISCLVIRAVTEFKVVERSVRHDGVDFWLADKLDVHPFQLAARMESKGITKARYFSDIREAIKNGIAQSKQSDHTHLPVYIIATDFGKPLICMVQR